MTRLKPSFNQVVIKVDSMILLISLAVYFWQGLIEHQWWPSSSVFSLLIPLMIMPVAVWYMFVPRLLEFSETEITLSTLLGKFTYAWSALDCYGPSDNVFMVQFSGDQQPYQIFAGAYPKDEWSKLTDILKTRFPDHKMAYFLGVKMYRKKGK